MSKRVHIQERRLKHFYEKENLTTFQIADKLGCCQATVWKKLHEYGIKPRTPGVKRVNMSKKQLHRLYIKKKLSTWKIEENIGIPRSTIHRKLKEFGIQPRNLSESHVIHPKKNFSGNLLEKAYLIGFRIGDLGVRKLYKNSKTVCVASGSTKEEQIDLLKKLFGNYGKIWISKNKNNKINFQVILDDSFNFLLTKEYPKWVEKNKRTFFSFLSGFTDAEGSIGIRNNRAYYSLGNYDSKLLLTLYKNLNKHRINCKKPKSDNRKGKPNNQGYKYKENYWQIQVHSKNTLEKLFLEIKPYIKHPNKIKGLNKAIENINQRGTLK